MSLVGWWKFENNTEDSSGYGNNGSGSPNYIDGKIGEAYDANSDSINVGNPEKIKKAFKGAEITISMWWRQNTNGSPWNDQINKGSHRIEHGRDDYDGGDHGPGYWVGLYDESGNKHNLVNNTISGISRGEWFHIVVRKDMDEMSVWINGEKNNSRSGDFSMGSYDSDDFVIGKSTVDDYIDNVRVYDRALSVKEIKQLSRAKVLHYKFDSFAEPTENMLPKALREMSSTSGWENRYHSSYSHQFVSNIDGREHIYELVHDGSANDDWHSRYYNLPTTSVGEEYVFSLDYKVTDGSDKPNNPRLYQDGWKTGGNADRELLFDKPIGNGWRRIAHKFTITTAGNPVLRMSTGYTSNQWTVYMDNFQYEKKDHATKFVNGTRETDILDSSGQENHGQLSVENTPKWTEKSKIGSGAYEFDGSGDMIPTELFYDENDLNAVTVSVWYKSSSSDDQIVASSDRNEYWRLGVGSDGEDGVLWTVSSSDMVSTASRSELQDGNWHHIVGVFDTSFNNDHKIYIDGSLDSEASYFNSGIGSDNKSYTHIGVGSEASNFDGSTGPEDWINGSVDEVRIYHEGLSASEVKQLYQQRASIDNKGDLHSREFSEDVYEGLKLSIESAGNDSPTSGYSKLVVNGNDIGATGRGINALEIDEFGNKINTESFDVYGSSSAETDNLVQFIENAESGNILMFAEDDHAGNIQSNGVSKLQSLGSEHIVDVSNDGRSSWAFMCKKASNKITYGETFAPSGQGPVFLNQTIPTTLNIQTKGTTETKINEVGPGSDSLVGWWPLDGNTKDYSGNGNNGTNNGATITSGLGQSAYIFDPNNNTYIDCGYIDELGSSLTQFTVMAWIKPNVETSGGIVSTGKDGGSSSSYGFLFDHGKSGWVSDTINFYLGNGSESTNTHATMDISYPASELYHVVGVFDRGDIHFYVNGENIGNDSVGFIEVPFEGTRPLYIGREYSNYGGVNYFDGKIQDVRVFNRALTPEEIKTLYNLTDPRNKQKVIQADNGNVYTEGEFNELM